MAPLISEHPKEIETVRRLLTPLIEARRQDITGKGENAADLEGVSTWNLVIFSAFLINPVRCLDVGFERSLREDHL